MSCIANDFMWWVSMIEIPVVTALIGFLWKVRQDSERGLNRIRDLMEARHAQIREGLSAYKLEVAKSYAQTSDMKDLEERLTRHLLRIEAKLDLTH